ncbi:MAG: pseudaminic acid cytidylyltransferase [Pseudomonadota bacterium]
MSYDVVSSIMGKLHRQNFPEFSDALADYNEKKRLNQEDYFDDRHVLHIEYKNGCKIYEHSNNILIILPARGGSKRIPRKNIKNICGQPMIYWPLTELNKAFDKSKIIISTDDQEVINTVENIGLHVPFKRPSSLADDYTGTTPVIQHALEWYERNVAVVDYVIVVYPTAVLLDIEDIIWAFNTLYEDEDCQQVMSATHFPFPIQRAVYTNQQGYAQMFEPENFTKRSQDLTPAMHDAGQFYIYRAQALREGNLLTSSNVRLHVLPRYRVVDIDTIEDFELAELMMKFIDYCGNKDYNG